jgi:hypothetical protein
LNELDISGYDQIIIYIYVYILLRFINYIICIYIYIRIILLVLLLLIIVIISYYYYIYICIVLYIIQILGSRRLLKVDLGWFRCPTVARTVLLSTRHGRREPWPCDGPLGPVGWMLDVGPMWGNYGKLLWLMMVNDGT